MKLKQWYVLVLILWAAGAVPGVILSFGLGDGPFQGLKDYSSPLTVIAYLFILCPIWLGPFGIQRRSEKGKS